MNIKTFSPPPPRIKGLELGTPRRATGVSQALRARSLPARVSPRIATPPAPYRGLKRVSRGRKDSFETLSGFRARRARETPVRGRRGCNPRTGGVRSGARVPKGPIGTSHEIVSPSAHVCHFVCVYVYVFVYVYVYIYICCGVIIWSKFGPFESYYLVQVCFFINHRLSKKTL